MPTNTLVLAKNDGSEWIFLYDDESTGELMNVLGRYASDPDLGFTWWDAAVLSQRVRKLKAEA